MRTTLTLADDVVVLLRKEAGRSGRMFRDVVNDAIRTGLSDRKQVRGRGIPPRVPIRVFHLGGLLVPDVDNVEEVLSAVEGEWRK